MLQHLTLHMFDAFATQNSAFVCIGFCICLHLLWHLVAFVVAFVASVVAIVVICPTMFIIDVCKCTGTNRNCWNKLKHIHSKCKCICKYICQKMHPQMHKVLFCENKIFSV